MPECVRIEVGAERIDIVQHDGLELRMFGEQRGEYAVAEEVRNLIPVSMRIKALPRHVVDIIVPLAPGASPIHHRRAGGLTHFLLLFVQHLLRHLFPQKVQIAHHGDEALPDRAPGRQIDRVHPFVPRLAPQVGRDRRMGQVAGGDDVRDDGGILSGGFPRFGQVNIEEAAVLPLDLHEGIERFDDPGALRPAAADPGGQ